MVVSKDCYNKYGQPTPADEPKYMTIYQVPADIRAAFAHVRFSALGTIGFPGKIYCNKDLVGPLGIALKNIIARNLTHDLKTWDGCFIVRLKRGQSTPSLHSWGIAIDINAFENTFGGQTHMSPAFVKCFTDAGLEWGGNWQKKDGMHFQLAKI